MEARLTIAMLRPEGVLAPGDIVKGDLALELVAVGFALPVTEEVETAANPTKVETATRRRKASQD